MWYLIAGLASGVIGGMGMGGGTILIPVISLLLDVEQKGAQLVNMVSFLPMAIATLIINAKSKLIRWREAIIVGLPGVLSAIGGSFLTKYIDSKALRVTFGVFLLLLGIYFVTSTIISIVRAKRGRTLSDINMVKTDSDNI